MPCTNEKNYPRQGDKGLNSKVYLAKIETSKIWIILEGKIFAANLKKKERKKCYPKININKITDNKAFCKTITPFLSSKASRPTRITLIKP